MMARLGEFLGKQGRLLLENDRLALLYIAVLALIPFAAWLSAAVVALITLRKGWLDGFKGFVVATLTLLILSLPSMPLSAAVITALMAFLPCYLTAALLHSTTSLKIAGFFIVLQALLVIALIHWLAPEFISNQYLYVQAIIKELERESSDGNMTSLLSNNEAVNKIVIANYIVGVQAVSVLLSAVVSLLLARSVQSRLYYPGGFKRDLVAFRASGFGVIILAIAMIGAYRHNPLALSCLPVLAVYYVFAGLSLSFNVLAKDKGVGTLALLLVPLILLPFVMLPVYVIFGALDSLFNFRLHLSPNAGGK
ncbi:DUF2232 domain-containing protein [Legionella micdadei]|uniref:Predicted membrane protein n=1 Tax=Legionella micdadei TaxID=451 RepID=A0A098GE52_LEGMI|nr:DUF2232 domain-containing protein [Legionella micdadei]ARG97665.1 hypothetical protein B6N58_08300 [Legionella micdadei]ARH00021.1 hypothetical protein B6V88_06120 [Legionella micdadei]KTD27754.1 membrane protein [Legionella micdadei]CEG60759.1 conserved membrane protein of unknown function [Legionella micdadei]SCY12378.1 Predicted membrane protein [Legionella micdadei]